MQERVRRLPGWLTFPEAADALGMCPQGIYKAVFDSGLFGGDDVFSVGSRLYVIREGAVTAEQKRRELRQRVVSSYNADAKLLRQARRSVREELALLKLATAERSAFLQQILGRPVVLNHGWPDITLEEAQQLQEHFRNCNP